MKKSSMGHKDLQHSDDHATADATQGMKGATNEAFVIGRHIKTVLSEEGRTVTWLAQQMGCTREYLYKVFSRTWISTDLLVTISNIMKHDFFRDYSRTLKYKGRGMRWKNKRQKTDEIKE